MTACYGSLPHWPTKWLTRITERQNAPEIPIGKPTTKYQQSAHNRYLTLPRPHKVKLNMEKEENKKVSCFDMKELFICLYFHLDLY